MHCQETDAKGPDKKKAKKGGGGAPGKRPKWLVHLCHVLSSNLCLSLRAANVTTPLTVAPPINYILLLHSVAVHTLSGMSRQIMLEFQTSKVLEYGHVFHQFSKTTNSGRSPSMCLEKINQCHMIDKIGFFKNQFCQLILLVSTQQRSQKLVIFFRNRTFWFWKPWNFAFWSWKTVFASHTNAVISWCTSFYCCCTPVSTVAVVS